MHTPADAPLLRDFARTGSERAFGEIVLRHTNLVYSAALRQCADPELAREITQDVFADLARKAPELVATLHDDASLGGWLYKGTRYLTLNALRDERRRVLREQKLMTEMDSTPGPDEWAAVAPVLDEAMAELNDAEREAVVLRYFQNLDFHAVGRALGVSDDTAQKRVSRALDRLREIISKRGVAAGGGGLAILISTNAVLVAPVGLSAAIIAGAVTATAITTTTTTTAVAAVTKTIAMTSLQKTLVAAVLAAAIGAGIYEERQASRWRGENQKLMAQLEQLIDERDKAVPVVASNAADLEQQRKDKNELVRLRGEIGLLRNQTNEMEKLRQQIRQLTASTVNAAPDTEEMPYDKEHGKGANTKMKRAMRAGYALIHFASKNQGQFPSNLAQALASYANSENDAKLKAEIMEAAEHAGEYDILYTGARKEMTNPPPEAAIILRDKQPWQTPSGTWARAYIYGSGMGLIQTTPDGNFESWESIRLSKPVSH